MITAGGLKLSKVASTVIIGLGGTAAVWAALKGFWLQSELQLRITYTAAAAFIIAAVSLALAVIVRSDVLARATATAAQYEARATVAQAFLSSAVPLVASPRYVLKKTQGEQWQEVTAFEVDPDEGLVAVVTSGDHIPAKQIKGLTRVAG